MRGSHINQRAITSEKYGHGAGERFLFTVIAGANLLKDFTHHIVQIRVRFGCRQGEEQKELVFVRYMDFVKPLSCTEYLFKRVLLTCSAYHDVSYTST